MSIADACVHCLRVHVVFSLCSAIACAPAERSGVATALAGSPRVAEVPGPAPRGREPNQAAALNDACEGCHAEVAREWRASLHSTAHTDPAYQRALAIEPLPFCQGCHAPEANPEAPVPEAAARLGVGCITCHVLDGQIAGATRAAAFRPSIAAAAHPVVRDGRLDSTLACAGCHEFAFPDRAARARPELMQSTVTEHARSPEQAVPCADCHMPVVEDRGHRHRSHRFPGGWDTEFVRNAVAVSAQRTGTDTVRIALTPRRVGHAFPTGDLFRRIEVSAEVVGAEWQVIASDRRYLARHWQRDARSPFGVVLRTAVLDDRPLGGRTEVELDLGARAAGLSIAWRVAYQRVEHPRSEDDFDSAVAGEIVLSEGTLED